MTSLTAFQGILMLALYQSDAKKDISEEIQKLSGTSIEGRESAKMRLASFGGKALESLIAELERSSDEGFRVELRDVIETIRKAERVRHFFANTRGSLKRSNVPAAELVGALGGAFKVAIDVTRLDTNERRYSIQIQDSDLWSALLPACKEAKVGLRIHSANDGNKSARSSVVAIPSDKIFPEYAAWCQVGEYLLLVDTSQEWDVSGRRIQVCRMVVLAPAAYYIDSGDIRNVVVSLGGNKLAPVEFIEKYEARRMDGSPTRVLIGAIPVDVGVPHRGCQVTLEGDLILQLPDDIRYSQTVLNDGQRGAVFKGQLVDFAVEKELGTAVMKVDVSAGSEAGSLNGSVFCSNGKWEVDFGVVRVFSGYEGQSKRREYCETQSPVLRCWKTVSTRKVVLPFRVSDIKLP